MTRVSEKVKGHFGPYGGPICSGNFNAALIELSGALKRLGGDEEFRGLFQRVPA